MAEDAVARRAAGILRERRDVLLARWERLLSESRDAAALVGAVFSRDPQGGPLAHLLARLNGRPAAEDFVGFHQWIYGGARSEVRLADVHRALRALEKAAAGVLAESAEDAEEAAALMVPVGAELDRMMARCIDLYEASGEVEVLAMRERLQRFAKAWRVSESIAGIESSRDLFAAACERLKEAFDLAGCVVRLYGALGERESELRSADAVPLPMMAAGRPQGRPGRSCTPASSPQGDAAGGRGERERHEGGETDVLELCHSSGRPFFCEVGASGAYVASAGDEARAAGELANAPELAAAGVRRFACLPMAAGGKGVGCLLLLVSARGEFRAGEVQLLEDLADVLAPAFARVAGIERSHRQVSKAEVIARIGESLLEMPTLEDLLQAVVDSVQQFRCYHRVSLFRRDERTGDCVLMAEAGPGAGGRDRGWRATPGEGLAGRCAAGAQVVEGHVEADGRAARALALPIRKGEGVIGVLEFVSTAQDAFDKTETDALEELSIHVGIALQSAEMLEDQRRYHRELEHVRSQLSTILRSTAVGIASMDRHGVYTHWSPSCQRLLGHDAEEVVGRRRFGEFCLESANGQNILDECLMRGQEVCEWALTRKDGVSRIIQETVVPMMSEAGKQVGFTSCMVDVTEKRRAEGALVEERDKLNLVVAAMGAGLALFDGQRRLQWANAKWMDWFQFTADSLNRTCDELNVCRRHPDGACPLALALQSGRQVGDTVEMTDRQGRWHCYMRVVTPLEHGETRLLCLMTDITEQRRQTEKVQLTNRLTLALEGSLDLNRVLHVVLTGVTAGHAIGFNRAFLFLVDDEGRALGGRMAVGPSSPEEARRIWKEITEQTRSLEDLISRHGPDVGDAALTERIRDIVVRLDDTRSILARTLAERRSIVVRDGRRDERVATDLAERLDLREFVCVPLIARNQPLGVMLADNKFTSMPIDDDRVDLLRAFSAQASLAIANAKAYQKITEQVEELKETHQELIEAERFAGVGRMATHLAHEIRNPLTAIGGFARVIRDSPDATDYVRRNAGIIYNESIRLEHTLAGALDFTRPSQPRKEPMDVNRLLTETIREFADELREHTVRLRLELEPGLPAVALDPNLIKQVVINLLKNAEQAVENVRDPVILISSQAAEEAVIVTVADNGCGMAPETVAMIFAPFFTTKVGGSGLGLSVSRKIVNEHGGDISVESELGRGSTFRVRLPLG